MNVLVRDIEVLQSIPGRNVALYLSANGWTIADKRSDNSTVWTHGERAGWIVVPGSPDFGDYALRMNEILTTVQEVEKRSQLEILFDILSLFDDVIRLRYCSDRSLYESIPFESGVQFVSGARGLLLSAAAAAVSAGQYFRFIGEKPHDYLDGVRWHPERGSFVLTVISPVVVSRALFEPELIPEPFARRVTRTLVQAVAAATEAARAVDEEGDFSLFEKAIELGVSANLCDALVELHNTGASVIDLSITWASGRDLPRPNLPGTIRMAQRLSAVFEEASRVLKGGDSSKVVELVGPTTDLHSEWMLPRHGADEVSQIVLAAIVDGKVRRVRLDLPMAEYLAALDAHRKGRAIRVKGVIRRDGNYYYLDGVHDFKVELQDIV